MEDDEEVLELGRARRGRRPIGRLLLVPVAAAGVVAYLAARGSGPSHPHAQATTSPSSSVSLSSAASSSEPRALLPRALPSWPRRNGACGNTAFLPLVSARPLDRSTGARVLVGDRLERVDLDTGSTHRLAGLPAGKYATDIATAGQGTFALLHSCNGADELARVVRIGRDGTLHEVAHGDFAYLLSGGRHPWGVAFDQSGDREWLDPLDGGPGQVFPARFSALGAFRDSVVGTLTKHAADPHSDYTVVLLNPRTGRVERNLGDASWVFYGQGRIVRTEPGCRNCLLHTLDLATGRETVSRRAVPRLTTGWGAVISPDGRSAAFIQPASTPARYDMEHPGNPNEIALVDLVSGSVRPVPGVTLWSKSSPGLTFSTDGRWLVIALDEGTGVRLLLWRPGLAEPRVSPARLDGRVAFSPAIVPQA